MLGASFALFSSLWGGCFDYRLSLCTRDLQHQRPLWWGQVAVPRWGFSSKWNGSTGNPKVQTIVFDKTGTLTEGKPVVTDIIGDEVEVLGLAASLEEASQHPLAEAVVKRAE